MGGMRQVDKIEGKNAILITIECTREDIARSIGFLEFLRTKGKKFSYAFSTSSWTAPSILSILTSTYPLMYGGNLKLQPPRKSIPEVLSKEGYFTAGFTYHPYLTRVNGYGRGFDDFEWSFREISSIYGIKKKRRGVNAIVSLFSPYRSTRAYARERRVSKLSFFDQLRKMISLLFKVNFPFRARVSEHLRYMRKYREYLRNDPWELGKADGGMINKKVMEVLSRIKRQQKFFIWIHYSEPHFPFSPPTKYLPEDVSRKKAAILNARRCFARLVPTGGKVHRRLSDEEIEGIKKLYISELRLVNDHIRNLIENLDSLGLLNNTGIFITSDHGEEFYEHKRFHHTFHLYDELIHLPLWIIGPDINAEEVSDLVSLVDLAPTILDFLGSPKPPGWIGESMLNSDRSTREIIISEATEDVGSKEMRLGHMNISKRKLSARSRRWKYIYNEAGYDELYNLEEDPRESINLINERPKIAYRMKKTVQSHINSEFEYSSFFEDTYKKIKKGRAALKT